MIAWRDGKRSATERGSAAVPFLVALPVMIGMMGLAIDLAYMYSRRNELQQLADTAALGAARKLNGTLAGVTAAKTEASDHAAWLFVNLREDIIWDDAALSFAASANSTVWKPVSAITSDATAAGLVYAKVDTASLLRPSGSKIGAVATFFRHTLAGESHLLAAQAVAGPTAVRGTPLAICALSTQASAERPHAGLASEKIEYGFRRGVSYNLLDLSPNSTPHQAYLINPVDPPGGTSQASSFSDNVLKHFFCNGNLPFTSLGKGSKVHVASIGSAPIHGWLNSRFNDVGNGCDPTKAASDTNVKEFSGTNADWMPETPTQAYAERTQATRDGVAKWVTVADLEASDTSSATPTTKSYGPLWTYSKPVSTGAAYTLADFPKLYTFTKADGSVVKVSAGDSTKYGTATGAYFSSKHSVSPTAPVASAAGRRVLNIPLLDCSGGNPDPGVAADVIGIGRFFMTARAKAANPASVPPVAASIPGEFAGAFENATSTRPVALYK